MAFLIDTSILGRLANRTDASHPVAKAAIAELHRRGEMLQVTAQNLVEFRNFATRPVSANGLGLAASAADGLLGTFEASFPLLPETPDIFVAWNRSLALWESLANEFMTRAWLRFATCMGCRIC
jgi:predicted nucleic acid-binding protein